MWDRALFALRRFALDLGGHLASWRLSVALMVLSALYQGLLAIWARSSSPEVVRSIAGLLPFWIVNGLLLVNTALCFWRRLPLLAREIAAGPSLAAGAPDAEWPADPARTRPGAARHLRRGGHRVVALDDGRLLGVRQRFASLGSFLFHGSLFLVGAAVPLTLATHQETRAWAATGEELDGSADQVVSRTPPRLLSGPGTPPALRVDAVRPEFWGEHLLFTRLEADLTFVGGRRATTRINRPLVLGPATFLRLAGYGLAPRWELRDRQGGLVDSAFVKMRVFPPGQRDSFRLGALPHRVYCEVLPDLVMEDGVPATRSLRLANPALVVRVMRGRLEVASGLVRLGEPLDVEGLRLSFPEIRPWAELSLVHDAGAPVLLAGFALGLLGLCLKARGRRCETEWRPGTDGTGGTWRRWGGAPLREGADPEALDR